MYCVPAGPTDAICEDIADSFTIVYDGLYGPGQGTSVARPTFVNCTVSEVYLSVGLRSCKCCSVIRRPIYETAVFKGYCCWVLIQTAEVVVEVLPA